MSAVRSVPRPRNKLLAALPESELARLMPKLERIPFEIRDLLFDYDAPIEYVYFVETGVASVVGVMSDGTAIETATIGNEGMVGLSLFHGVNRVASQGFCQVPGEALRMTADDFRVEIANGTSTLVTLLGRYTEALFAQVGQSSACNRLHSSHHRCARWLLQTHDRVGEDTFPLTHQFLAQMLGVRRATVSEAAGALQERGIIEYRMGVIRILDRAALEEASCECYAIIKREFDRLIDGRDSPSPIMAKTSFRGKSKVKPPATDVEEEEERREG